MSDECWHCGHQVHHSWTGCPTCNAPLQQVEEAPACPTCGITGCDCENEEAIGAINEAMEPRCTNCGAGKKEGYHPSGGQCPVCQY
jgi:DNA-directed RNA polymerase subunit RPC12/RpoP